MYTIAQARGKGVASRLLFELESWARELGVEKLVLKTGKRHLKPSIGLYKKNHFDLWKIMVNMLILKMVSAFKNT